jgi:hypothetical protein
VFLALTGEVLDRDPDGHDRHASLERSTA